MKERPILFSTPMVRALREGRKTQTRRIAKLPPAPMSLGTWEVSTVGGEGCTDSLGRSVPEMPCLWHTRNGATVSCPYGQTGDRLWVRETWGTLPGWDDILPNELPISLNNSSPSCEVFFRADHGFSNMPAEVARWRPSIHMPRRASRITLEIESVRVERLNEISNQDAKSEGITWEQADEQGDWDGLGSINLYRGAFKKLWESINGPGSWNANPWVWVVSFKRV